MARPLPGPTSIPGLALVFTLSKLETTGQDDSVPVLISPSFPRDSFASTFRICRRFSLSLPIVALGWNRTGGNRPANSNGAKPTCDNRRRKQLSECLQFPPPFLCRHSFLCFSLCRGCRGRNAATGVRGDIRRNAEGARDGGTA